MYKIIVILWIGVFTVISNDNPNRVAPPDVTGK